MEDASIWILPYEGLNSTARRKRMAQVEHLDETESRRCKGLIGPLDGVELHQDKFEVQFQSFRAFITIL